MSKSIEELIGKHPEKPDFFAEWLSCEDIPPPTTNPDKKYRKLSANSSHKDSAIDEIAEFLVKHLVTDADIHGLRQRKKEIHKKYSYEQHLEAQELIPKEGTVRQGNLGEILFIEYLKSLKKYDFLVFKLAYTTNVTQAMKGDDILMFDKNNLRNILLGEAKCRAKSSTQIIEEILESFGGTMKIPTSITFVVRMIHDRDPKLSYHTS